MGWWWSSSSSDSKREPQQPTPASIPIRTAPTAPSQSSSQSSDANINADFHAAYPHLAPSQTPATTPITPEDTDPSIPTTMSCRAAFDAAFYCSSLGGHFNDIYRYGQLRSCSEHWADWRFCMSLTSSSSEAKAQAIQARYKEKEAQIREKPSSEDVWRRRGPEEMIVAPFGRAEEEARRVEGS